MEKIKKERKGYEARKRELENKREVRNDKLKGGKEKKGKEKKQSRKGGYRRLVQASLR